MEDRDIYNKMYESGGFEGVYDLPFRQSCYYPLQKQVLAILKKNKISSVLDVGCGSGAFAALVLDRSAIDYRGFDFSDVAINKARLRTGKSNLFLVGDATDSISYDNRSYVYDSIVCMEVLEHVEDDIKVVSNWASGLFCVFSVPNFDSKYHVRYFTDEKDVVDRYGKYFHIDKIKRVKKPCFADISLRNYLRHLRWNRYRPNRLLEILGFGDFDKVGGWFLVWGMKL